MAKKSQKSDRWEKRKCFERWNSSFLNMPWLYFCSRGRRTKGKDLHQKKYQCCNTLSSTALGKSPHKTAGSRRARGNQSPPLPPSYLLPCSLPIKHLALSSSESRGFFILGWPPAAADLRSLRERKKLQTFQMASFCEQQCGTGKKTHSFLFSWEPRAWQWEVNKLENRWSAM